MSALTTAQAFDLFMERISPTDSDRLDVSSKTTTTRGLLQTAFPASSNLPLARMVQIGSVDRGTCVRPVNDLDVLAEFSNKGNIFNTYRYDSSAFLQRVRDALNAKTSIKKIGARGQAVRLFYVAGAHVDIVPVFKWSSGGFAYPNGSGGWATTDPEAQAVWYSGRRAALGQELTNVVKLLRRWNGVHSGRFESYHLEVMACSVFSSVGGNWREAFKVFFQHASNYIGVADPAGHSGSLDEYVTWDVRVAMKSRFSEAYDRAVNAMAAESQSNHTEAKRLWRIEMGPEFPD